MSRRELIEELIEVLDVKDDIEFSRLVYGHISAGVLKKILDKIASLQMKKS